ncbi:MAG: hypothetical protein ACR2M7_00910 [Bdellovibrionales bacterium]
MKFSIRQVALCAAIFGAVAVNANAQTITITKSAANADGHVELEWTAMDIEIQQPPEDDLFHGWAVVRCTGANCDPTGSSVTSLRTDGAGNPQTNDRTAGSFTDETAEFGTTYRYLITVTPSLLRQFATPALSIPTATTMNVVVPALPPAVTITSAQWNLPRTAITVEWSWENYNDDLEFLLSRCIGASCTAAASANRNVLTTGPDLARTDRRFVDDQSFTTMPVDAENHYNYFISPAGHTDFTATAAFPVPPNPLPTDPLPAVVTAGDALTVGEGDVVTLDASASSDMWLPTGEDPNAYTLQPFPAARLGFQWFQASTASGEVAVAPESHNYVALDGADTHTATFTARDDLIAAQTLYFWVRVTGSTTGEPPTAQTATARVTVTVTGVNAPPSAPVVTVDWTGNGDAVTATAGTPIAIPASTADTSVTVTLTATSTDEESDGDALVYTWAQSPSATAVEFVMAGAVLDPTVAATATFTAPTDAQTLYFLVVVVDGTIGAGGEQSNSRVTLRITPEDAPTATVAMAARRFAPSTPGVGEAPGNDVLVALDGRGTSGGDSFINGYAWTCNVASPSAAAVVTATGNSARDAIGANTALPNGDFVDITPTATTATLPTATFTAPRLKNAMGEALYTLDAQAVTSIALHCDLRVRSVAGGESELDPRTTRTVVTIGTRGGGGEVVNRAVLPHVLRNMTDAIHTGIFKRIYERQVRDGFWKP